MDPLQTALDDARQQLTDLKASHAELVTSSEGANADDEHDPEGATIAFEREQLQALVVSAQERVQAAEQALRLRAQGGYGTCEACGRPIGEERLAARPTTTLCIDCATAAHRR